MKPFDMLHVGVRRFCHDQGWTKLRPIQEEAIRVILSSPDDVIVSARTAGGKTEAAFLPIISAIADSCRDGVRAIYVGPLKALINDQFRRMEDLCQHLDVPVYRWHGDVGEAARKKLLAEPGGVLLITPESIEAMFLHRIAKLRVLMGRLDYVVIDELHIFPGTERGMHLRSLLSRLEQVRGASIRRIGLSATLGSKELAQEWLRPSNPNGVRFISQPHAGVLQTRVHAYMQDADDGKTYEPSLAGRIDPVLGIDEGNLRDRLGRPTPAQMAKDIYFHHRQGVNLVFANAKRDLELITPVLRGIAAHNGLPEDAILIHHGSLSKELREDAEALLKDGQPHLCCCSSTLELGIDIGNAKAVGHLGAPYTVASLAQRLGRSGRREGEPSIFRQYITIDPQVPTGADEAGLHLELIRAIALVELFKAGWIEPPEVNRWHLSTLVHQILAILAERGGATAKDLYATLTRPDVFLHVDAARFAGIVRELGRREILEQSPDGQLLLGLRGERIVGSRDFCAAFQSKQQFRVVCSGRLIGSLPLEGGPKAGDPLLLAGKPWQIQEIVLARLEIVVTPWKGRRPPVFGGSLPDVHDRVVTQMRQVLGGQTAYPYLDGLACEALAQAREFYHRNELNARVMSPCGPSTVLWAWQGSRVLRTLAVALEADGLKTSMGQVSLNVQGSGGETEDALNAFVAGIEPLTQKWLCSGNCAPLGEKFDWLLSEQDLIEQFVDNNLDIEAGTAAAQWILSHRQAAVIDAA